MDEPSHGELLDLIYETVLQPDLWVSVMERLADAIGGNSGWLSRIDTVTGKGSGVIARIDPVMPRRYIDYYGGLNPIATRQRPADYFERWTPTVVSDEQLIDRDLYERSEFFNDFMRPQDVGGALMFDLDAERGEVVTMNIHRRRGSDSFSRRQRAFAESLQPHILRAFRLNNVFGDIATLAEGAVSALDQSDRAHFLLDARGRLRHVNRAGEAMLARRDGLGIMASRLVATRSEPAKRLERLIARAASTEPGVRSGGSFVLATEQHGVLSVTAAPLYPERLTVFTSGPAVLVSVTDLSHDVAAPDEMLRDLFRLSPAEIRLLHLLMNGLKPREASARLGVSLTTVRAQLSSMFDKTGTANQADLSRLVMRLSVSLAQ